MTTFLLIRHGAHDLLGNTLAGRTRDVSLNAEGRQQAARLVPRLSRFHLDRLCTSPRVRAVETAVPLARARSLALDLEPRLDEIDFGAWSGRAFSDLAREPMWKTWCEQRGQAEPPGGETLRAVQERAIAALGDLRDAHPEGTVAVVSHGDVLKAALAHVLHMSLDHLERFDVAPASLSLVIDGGAWRQVTLLNATD